MRPLLLLAALASLALAQETFSGSAALDAQMQQAIKDGLIPGGVLLVGHDGNIVHFKAYGQRALVPSREAMTVDTIFDLASLTKVVATTPAIMKLFEQGKIRLIDPVTVYLPEFQGGRSDITVRDLLTHFSGLRPDLDVEPAWSGYDTGIRKALIDKPTYPPGERFIYSDINFELLGEIVRRVSGETLDKFVREQVYQPLGMRDTMYLPPSSLRPRIAPTEVDATMGEPWRGVVHDPTARYMGGVAGHAGVFSTASDLARYCEMLLGLGERAGVRVFAPATVEKFTEAATPPDQPVLRSPGWDIDSSYSSARGELFPIGSYGHLGYTGTSIWIDPASKSYVILLTNYVHPKSGKNLSPLRRSISTIAAAALGVGSAGVNETGYNETLEAS
jgi:CubicO group peptidase (beta-lactamase class C family)